MRNSLGYLRATGRLARNVVDGWQLLHVGLSCVRELPSDAWVSAFKRVNLHPHFRVSFAEW